MPPRRWLGLVPTLVLLSGLALAEPNVVAAGQAERDVGQAVLPPSPHDFHSPDDQLGALIVAALRTHPDLLSARHQWHAALERGDQVSSLPDPQLHYRWFARSPETRVGPQEHMLELSQALPWAGKRSWARQSAEHLAHGAAWNVRQQAAVLVAGLKRAYFQSAYLQQALAINADETELLRRFERIALTRYATGGGIQQNVVRVQTEISRLEDQAISLRRLLAAEERRVARAIGPVEGALPLAPVRLDIPDIIHDVDELLESAFPGHPLTGRLLAQEDAAAAALEHRKLASRPDFKVGLGYTFVADRADPAGVAMPPVDNGRDIVGISLGVNLPIQRRRIKAGIGEANLQLLASREALAGLRRELAFQIQENALRMDAARERARLYAEVVVPQAEASLSSAEAAYATHRLDFLDLLESQRVLFQVRLTHERMVADYWLALTDLEFHLGHRFPSQPDHVSRETDREEAS